MNDRVKEIAPKQVTLKDGATLDLRPMTAADRDAVLAFARNLPEEDLQFMRVDLTDPDVVDEWVRNLGTGHSISLLAWDANGVAGYATVHRNPARWTRRVGEIRVSVSPEYRSRGLGRIMTGEVFDIARTLGLRKLMANMTVDQRGAQGAFRRLGFVAEALLADYVEDRNGTSRDLIIMSYDIDGHTEQVDERVRI
ncbi:MAG: GNAT family N-acetyltransferase [Pseudomonadales bacterium]